MGPYVGPPGYQRQAPYCFPCYNGSTGGAFAPSQMAQRVNVRTYGYRHWNW